MGKGARSAAHSVFFSNVPYTTTAGYLRKVFSQAGRVEDLELYFDSRGRSIGAGVVRFGSHADVQRSVSQLHDHEVDGRLMLVKANEQEDRHAGGAARVFFNGVPYVTTEGYLRAQFEHYGTIVDFDLWRTPDWTSQGMGTCEYSSSSGAESAIAGLNGALIDGRRILVQPDSRPGEEAQTKGRGGKGQGKGQPHRRVFWSNVPEVTTEGYLRRQFEQVGNIVDFDFWRRPDGMSLGMGVCEFDHHLGVWRAHERLHGREIDGGRLLIKNDDGGSRGRIGGKGGGKWAAH